MTATVSHRCRYLWMAITNDIIFWMSKTNDITFWMSITKTASRSNVYVPTGSTGFAAVGPGYGREICRNEDLEFRMKSGSQGANYNVYLIVGPKIMCSQSLGLK